MDAGTQLNTPNESAAESFAVYLAKQFVYKKGYKPIVVQEAAELPAACDIMLTNTSGMSVEMICIIDAERFPEKRFTMEPSAVQAIGAACQKYSASVHSRKIPPTIKIIEVGAGIDSPAERERLASYSASSFSTTVQITGWIVDTAKQEVWSSGALGGKFLGKSFIAGLLRAPREHESTLRAAASVAVAGPSFPIVTYALLALLVALFCVELAFGVGPSTGLFEPSLQTLVALGGSSKQLVLGTGEWYRLCSAIFLHGGAMHLLMNGIALLMVGYVLERMVGRIWYLALFFLGGLGGSLMSLAVNAPNIVSIGASGAIMGLFAAAFACSFRLPAEAGKTMIQVRLMQVLIPSLLPLMSAMGGAKVDYGAHFGGAIMGAICGYGLRQIWPANEIYPKFRGAAVALVAAGLLAMAGAAIMVKTHYPDYALAEKLMPEEAQLHSEAEIEQKSAALLAQYPDDPRTHLYRAVAFIRSQNLPAAESELRTGISKATLFKMQFTPALKHRLQAMLALVLNDEGKTDEAKQLAAPLCSTAQQDGTQGMLSQAHFCR